MPGDNGQGHAVEVSTRSRFRSIEIAVSVEPNDNDAALGMVKTRKYALADIAASGQYQRKLFGFNGAPDHGCEALANN
jgi:hypothetical protein